MVKLKVPPPAEIVWLAVELTPLELPWYSEARP